MTDKEMAYPPGLSLHGNSWRITKRIPTELLPHYNGKKHLRLNTGKSDKREAASVAWQWHAEQEAEFGRLRKTGRREKTSIAPADIQWLVGSMLASTLGAHEEGLLEGGTEEARTASDALAFLRESVKVAMGAGDFSGVGAIADDWLWGHGYDLPENSEDRRRVLVEFAKGVSRAFQALEARQEGRWVDTPPAPSMPSAGVPEGVLMLSAVVSAFLDKQDKSLSMFSKYSACLALFLEVVGDVPVQALRQTAIDDFFALLCKLPPRWSDAKRKRRCSVAELAAMEWPKTLAPKTFEDTYMAALRPFLKDARRLYGDQGFPLSLTTDGIKYTGTRKDGEDKQRALRPDELHRLYHGPECVAFAADPAQAHRYWLPLVGLYTGARVNEVCQVNPQCDIREEEGVWFFNITEETEAAEGVAKSVKNKTSFRPVPIHSQLVELGFLGYLERVKASGARLLFPEWGPSGGRASANAERWFRRHLEKLGLRDETPGARIVGFHCYRHTFLTRADELDVHGAESLTGHTDASVSAVVRGYRGRASLVKQRALMERVVFNIDPPKPVQ